MCEDMAWASRDLRTDICNGQEAVCRLCEQQGARDCWWC